ncbi:hypothetical protein LARI1_G008880 [Lachnellula arida]|uniref:Uncharacterized protein n=1 Tax=Lachnellula arida TaxID=1316785 RepID=A0A8T9B1U8_9HELO|nr:hypothetical protein LARI1_G008880 [Lachnellula arida]
MAEHDIHTQPRDIQPCLILFNGFPGVGKLTLAKNFQEALQLQQSSITTRLIDNHVLIDPVEAIEPGRTPAHYALRKAIRKAAFDGLKALDHGVVILMTTCLAANAADIEVFEEYVEVALARGVPLISINVYCDEATNEQRLCSEERRGVREGGGKTKLVDKDVLAAMRREHVLLDAAVHLERGETRGVNIEQWRLDTSSLSVEEAVRGVFDLFCRDLATVDMG